MTILRIILFLIISIPFATFSQGYCRVIENMQIVKIDSTKKYFIKQGFKSDLKLERDSVVFYYNRINELDSVVNINTKRNDEVSSRNNTITKSYKLLENGCYLRYNCKINTDVTTEIEIEPINKSSYIDKINKEYTSIKIKIYNCGLLQSTSNYGQIKYKEIDVSRIENEIKNGYKPELSSFYEIFNYDKEDRIIQRKRLEKGICKTVNYVYINKMRLVQYAENNEFKADFYYNTKGKLINVFTIDKIGNSYNSINTYYNKKRRVAKIEYIETIPNHYGLKKASNKSSTDSILLNHAYVFSYSKKRMNVLTTCKLGDSVIFKDSLIFKQDTGICAQCTVKEYNDPDIGCFCENRTYFTEKIKYHSLNRKDKCKIITIEENGRMNFDTYFHSWFIDGQYIDDVNELDFVNETDRFYTENIKNQKKKKLGLCRLHYSYDK